MERIKIINLAHHIQSWKNVSIFEITIVKIEIGETRSLYIWIKVLRSKIEEQINKL